MTDSQGGRFTVFRPTQYGTRYQRRLATPLLQFQTRVLPAVESLCRDFNIGLQDIGGLMPLGTADDRITFHIGVDPSRNFAVDGWIGRAELGVVLSNPPDVPSVDAVLNRVLGYVDEREFVARGHLFGFFSHSVLEGATARQFLDRFVRTPDRLAEGQTGVAFAVYGVYEGYEVSVTVDRSLVVPDGVFLNVVLDSLGAREGEPVSRMLDEAHRYFFDVALGSLGIDPRLP